MGRIKRRKHEGGDSLLDASRGLPPLQQPAEPRAAETRSAHRQPCSRRHPSLRGGNESIKGQIRRAHDAREANHRSFPFMLRLPIGSDDGPGRYGRLRQEGFKTSRRPVARQSGKLGGCVGV